MRIGKRTAAFVLSATLAAILACLPWSGWLVRQQIRAAVGGSLSRATAGKTLTAEERTRERQTAVDHSHDFGLQLAIAYQNRPGILEEPAGSDAAQTGESDRTKAARHLWSLRDRFPQEPSLYANLLRYLTADAVRIRRESETEELEPMRGKRVSPPVRPSSRPENTPEFLAMFDSAAALGEQFDPENGYFSAMRAIGLFAAHRDAEALSAIHRASLKSEWKEYSVDEVQGILRLSTLTSGEPGSFARFGQMSSLLFFHYSSLYQTARLATVQAIRLEQGGNPSKGFLIRRDTARLGALMRTRSSYLIGSLLGDGISKIAQLRPGGAPPIPQKSDFHHQDAEREPRIREAYCSYLIQIGESEEAAFIQAEEGATKSIQGILEANNGLQYIRRQRPAATGWVSGTALLSSVFVLLVYGAVCRGGQDSKFLKHKRAFPTVVFASLLLLGGTLTFLGSRIIEPWNKWLTVFQGIAAYSEGTPDPIPSNWELISTIQTHLLGLLAFSLPLLLVLILAHRSRKQTILPNAVSFARTCAASAVPAATILLFLYNAVAAATLCTETVLRNEADRFAENENLTLAALSHRKLPGFSPGHDAKVSVDKELSK